MTRTFKTTLVLLVATTFLSVSAQAQSTSLVPPTAKPAAVPTLQLPTLSPPSTTPATATSPTASISPVAAGITTGDMGAEKVLEKPSETTETTTTTTPFKSSMGASQLSIFFSPLQIRVLRDALQTFEQNGNHVPRAGNLSITSTQAPATQAIVEPETYPVFYLSSIVYHSKNDWAVWISGHKITSRKNTTDLKVIAVSSDRASFLWSPVFKEALVTRQQRKLFASIAPVKNKLTKPATYMFDEKTGTVSFSLRANQTFLPGYMNTFEGYLDSPKLDKLMKETLPPSASSLTENMQAPSADLTPATDTLINTTPVNPLDALKEGGSRKAIDAQLKRQDSNTQ